MRKRTKKGLFAIKKPQLLPGIACSFPFVIIAIIVILPLLKLLLCATDFHVDLQWT